MAHAVAARSSTSSATAADNSETVGPALRVALSVSCVTITGARARAASCPTGPAQGVGLLRRLGQYREPCVRKVGAAGGGVTIRRVSCGRSVKETGAA